jgi:hypothetical protein
MVGSGLKIPRVARPIAPANLKSTRIEWRANLKSESNGVLISKVPSGLRLSRLYPSPEGTSLHSPQFTRELAGEVYR